MWKRWKVSVTKIAPDRELLLQRPLKHLKRDQYFTGVIAKKEGTPLRICLWSLCPQTATNLPVCFCV